MQPAAHANHQDLVRPGQAPPVTNRPDLFTISFLVMGHTWVVPVNLDFPSGTLPVGRSQSDAPSGKVPMGRSQGVYIYI